MTARNVTNVLPCDPLNAVSTRFVERFAACNVGVDEGFRKYCKLNM